MSVESYVRLVELMNHGFILYQFSPTKFKLIKAATPIDDRKLTIEQEFDNFDDAYHHATKLVDERTFQFEVVVRYNRGLGPEQKVLNCVDARTLDEAQKLAEAQARVIIKEDEIIQVKARPMTIQC